MEELGADMVTVAVRRVNILDKKKPILTDYLNPKKIKYLPNTAGCYSSEEALRTLRLAREMGGWKLVKLEVLGDKKTLYPNMIETLKSTKILVKEGFKVMVYCTDDPLLSKKIRRPWRLAIMPLASPIGSGLGIQNKVNISLIIKQSKVPVIIDAGIGTASDALPLLWRWVVMEFDKQCDRQCKKIQLRWLVHLKTLLSQVENLFF